MTPRRIQLKRARGWRMPAGAIKVDRSTRFGNPFDWREAQGEWGCSDSEARAVAVSIFRDWVTMREPERFDAHLLPRLVAILAGFAELRGRDLACWCPLPAEGEPDHCHAAVLIDLANRP